MFATSLTAALVGVEARLVRVEADTSGGFPKFTMVGLADSCVRESEARVRAALRNCGYDFHWDRRITVNLAPADLRKMGSSFDLATAIGLLAAEGTIASAPLRDVLLVGELALDGEVRPVTGVLPMVLAARQSGIPAALVPEPNAAEACLVPGVQVFPVRSLSQAVEIAASTRRPEPVLVRPPPSVVEAPPDMRDVRGQPFARRAMEIAAAGGHNLLLVGPPGSGKTMLARRLPGLLPPLLPEQALETSIVYSAGGRRLNGLLSARPFRSPHHTASDVALVGGGSFPRPGEISLAHNGVLFLDELPEFRRHALEALRQPLEEGFVVLSRARGTVRLPACFQLTAAMNPCPCGFLGDTRRGCRCSPRQIDLYRARLSGPLLDRVDLRVPVGSLTYADLTGPPGEASAPIAARVARARDKQLERADKSNARLQPSELRELCRPEPAAKKLLARAVDRFGLTGRAHDRVLRVAQTLADLDGEARLTARHIAEALQFRGPENTPSKFLENRLTAS